MQLISQFKAWYLKYAKIRIYTDFVFKRKSPVELTTGLFCFFELISRSGRTPALPYPADAQIYGFNKLGYKLLSILSESFSRIALAT